MDNRVSAITSVLSSAGSHGQGRNADTLTGPWGYDALPFNPETKCGIFLVALTLSALTWMVYHILNLLGNLTHTLVEKGPNAAVAPLRHFAEDLDLVQDGKFNGIPVAVATDLVPLSYVSFLPFLCFMRAAFCCTSGHAAYDRQSMPRTGRRILRRIGLGVRASGQLLAIARASHAKRNENEHGDFTSTVLMSFVSLLVLIAYVVIFGEGMILDMPIKDFIVDIVPLLYVTLIPVFCGLRAALTTVLCGRARHALVIGDEEQAMSKQTRRGQRVLRRIHLGVHAIGAIQRSGFSMRVARAEAEALSA